MKAILILGAFLLAGAAQAAQLSCAGKVEDFNVTLVAQMQGDRFTSDANVKITHGKEVLRDMVMHVTESQFVPGKGLNFRANNNEGAIAVSLAYNGSQYVGNVDAVGQQGQGNITLPAACSIF